MKKTFPLYFLLIALAGLNASCDKTLNALPTQEKVDDNVIVDQKSAEIALNGVYYLLVNVTENRTTGLPGTTWAPSHEVLPARFAGLIENYQGPSQADMHTLKSRDGEVLNIWSEGYKLANAANGVIAGIDAINEQKFGGKRRDEILGEVRFLRAYANFKLLAYYGEFFDINSNFGVMIRTKPVTVSTIATPRKKVKETYDFILEDVDYAITHAPETNPNYYATKWAAILLKMRVLMLRQAASDYPTVVTLANQLIEQSPYALEAHVEDLFATKGLASKEVILGTKAFANQIAEMEKYYFRANYTYNATPLLLDLLKNDPRANWMIGTVAKRQVFKKHTGGQAEAKFIFRLTEAYLLKAEALAKSNGSLTEVRDLLKIVKSKAGITDFTALNAMNTREQLTMEVFREIIRSLTAEDGSDWIALLRLPFETVKQFNGNMKEKWQYILPVPYAEYEKNPTFGEQNPGYGW
ncbi:MULTISPECIES: RagB/SusD family nutrient uptake outer membrane protein [Sphingobacterium]|uniref:RagB/SusD family nutrient uptake outer membrane protein n=1 Tax=Sphingobacterium TaxID=28453 RepID=UPI00257E39F0|nr:MULTISPECIES: RagB/SusD family nutrient uptake outer membrane protein [Sphingobacterium]